MNATQTAVAKYRVALPQLTNAPFLTDGGIETTLIFHDGLELPHFAAYDLLTRDGGTEASRLGHSTAELAELNRRAVRLLDGLRADYETETTPIVISGCIGPRGDGYVVGAAMTADEAEAYHSEQIGTFAGSAADLVTAITMTYVDEAVGIVRAARAAGLPVVISFTVETDGRLPSGQSLRDAIEEVDSRTDGAAAYFMVNCAHPSHFEGVLEAGEGWTARIRGLPSRTALRPD